MSLASPSSTLPDAAARLQAAITDRYVLGRELGRGGMAVVYLAQDLKHDRPVAIKVLRSELGHLLGPERFQREIRLAAQLQHLHDFAVGHEHDAAALADAMHRHFAGFGFL